MKYIFYTFFLLLPVYLFSQKHSFLLAGTYTNGKSTGIYVYDFNSADGSAKVIDSVKTSNPSYLAISADGKFVYAVNENADYGHGGSISFFNFDKATGQISKPEQNNVQPTMGDDPCYISIDKTGKWITAANYSSGSFSLFPINKNGVPDYPKNIIVHSGRGPNKQRQQAPHVHETVFSADNKYLFVPDLGIDKIMIYSFNAENGSIKAAKQPFVKLKNGSGPRHFDFHPSGKWAYSIQELAGTITAFNYANGKLKRVQTISSLPAAYKGTATSAEIYTSPDGRFLYASNRDASNTIAIFKINEFTGKLSLIGHQATMGKTPRNFNFDPTGNYLLVANQNSDTIVVFKIDHKIGLLTDTGKRIEVSNPVCIKWIEN